MQRKIAVVGTGYVGLTTGACLAALGHHVVCADIDSAKVDRLRQGHVDILEPGLDELVTKGLAAGNLEFVLGASNAVSPDTEVLFLCVPTPMGADGAADLRAVESVLAEVGDLLPPGCAVATKSTVPVGTAERLRHMVNVPIVANPEFLREGTAVDDFLHPDRIVVGSADREAAQRVGDLYAKLQAPTLVLDAASAEMVKYAANCFLAVKLSYVNAIAQLCDRVGADVREVTEGMGLDPRIGRSFLKPGPGWGGSCLPKDTNALLHVAEQAGLDFGLLRSAIEQNERQQEDVVARIRTACDGTIRGARIGLLGLAFKAGTNDLRDSPAIRIADALVAEGAEITAHDPAITGELPGMRLVDDPYEAVKGAIAVVVLTEWPEFRTLDWTRVAELMDGFTVVDTRDLLDGNDLGKAGLRWTAIGRPSGSG
ncbi:UDP-glucose/GDP-mannose dehydrogenase family protein [Kibdelosporangium philippinense]|uniref:UDP-glucose 6-dehydrogenase n=1 Tax=Kibdelosporangium philippinense TaxID=211113 RepID=A0ABS8ZDR2_9PSEU|nr:UDP-glucose/GDP-mannose dehydrogenase family protein [Kibdelosporangium philippinense]MCE7005005.1 UDP-glucose/GDP-mannose dehydrogenase family protein [Kibdelosporangium philippinense]